MWFVLKQGYLIWLLLWASSGGGGWSCLFSCWSELGCGEFLQNLERWIGVFSTSVLLVFSGGSTSRGLLEELPNYFFTAFLFVCPFSVHVVWRNKSVFERHHVSFTLFLGSCRPCHKQRTSMHIVSDDILPQACSWYRCWTRSQQAVCYSLCHCVRDRWLPLAGFSRLRSSGLCNLNSFLFRSFWSYYVTHTTSLDGIDKMLGASGRVWVMFERSI